MDFINSDRTLKVGDFVLSSYHKSDLLFKIVDLERRFLTQDDLKYHSYENGSIGDEYNPYVTIETITNLSITTDPSKKIRKTIKGLDASWLRKVTPEHLEAHIHRLQNMLGELWP